jgi:DNA-binding XRE family transcriptional regulator
MHKRRDFIEEGQQAYQEWRDSLLANPEFRVVYEEEAAKKELWLQLVEARQKAGLTQAELARRLGVSQAQVARMEKRGYDAYTLNSLRRYVQALGEGFSLDVVVRQIKPKAATPIMAEQKSNYTIDKNDPVTS